MLLADWVALLQNAVMANPQQAFLESSFLLSSFQKNSGVSLYTKRSSMNPLDYLPYFLFSLSSQKTGWTDCNFLFNQLPTLKNPG
jgi:hypothetical protein